MLNFFQKIQITSDKSGKICEIAYRKKLDCMLYKKYYSIGNRFQHQHWHEYQNMRILQHKIFT